MIAQKAPMQYSTAPPPQHTLKSRPMDGPERALLGALINQKSIPIAVVVVIGVFVLLAVVLNIPDNGDPFSDPTSSSLCAPAFVIGVIMIGIFVSTINEMKPLQTALQRGTVTDITAVCTVDGTRVTVGPIYFTPSWYQQGSIPAGATVTVGFVQGANIMVSMNGAAFPKAIKVVPTHDIAALEGSSQYAEAQMAVRADQAMIKEIRYERGGIKKTTYATEPAAAPVVIVIVKCSKCGASMQPEWKACPACGASVIDAPKPVEKPPEPKPEPKPEPRPVEVPKPVETPKVIEPREPRPPSKYCPFHGLRTIVKNGKPWCNRCNDAVDEPPVFCPYHGCRTEPRDGSAYCPRCKDYVEPL